MPPIMGPTTSTVDPEILNRLNTPQATEAVRSGNVDQILKATGLSKKDWEDYLKSQNVSLNRDVIQDYQIYASPNSVPAPQWAESFSPEIGVGKAFAVGGKSQEAPPSLVNLVEGQLKETDDLIASVMGSQMKIDYDRETKKIQEEVRRLVATAVTFEDAVNTLAYAKSRTAGLDVARLGKKIYDTNMQQTKLADQISKLDFADPKNAGQLHVLKQKEAAMSMQMSQDTNMLQTAAQNVESILNFAKSVCEQHWKTEDALSRNQQVKS